MFDIFSHTVNQPIIYHLVAHWDCNGQDESVTVVFVCGTTPTGIKNVQVYSYHL